MKLCEHPEFEQAILNAVEHFAVRKLRPAVIEKDYYVTEALRAITQAAGPRVIFKGGTSLSKGWNLIDRFSEDIDLFLDPTMFEPELGKRGIDRELKKLRDHIAAHPALVFDARASQTIGGFGRTDSFSYEAKFGGPGEVAPRVLLEAGTASGREPVADIELSSLLAEFLLARDISLGAEDEQPFTMRLLHFRRTFVEKLFAIHSKVTGSLSTGEPLGSYARHYYDLAQLSKQPEVVAMLESDEYLVIKTDYDQVSRRFFGRDYAPPIDLSFANSVALFPDERLSASLGEQYTRQCELLCFGEFPSWSEVLQRFSKLQPLL
jgi:hypothetical protein